MRSIPLIALALLAGCYQVELPACLVRCADLTHACPEGLLCGDDDFCHAASEPGLCSAGPDGQDRADGTEASDGLVDLDAIPVPDGFVSSDALSTPDAPDDPCFGLCTGTQVCTAPCNCCCEPGDAYCCTAC